MERNSDTRQIKYEVLRAVSEHMFRGDLNEETMDQIPFQIIRRLLRATAAACIRRGKLYGREYVSR